MHQFTSSTGDHPHRPERGHKSLLKRLVKKAFLAGLAMFGLLVVYVGIMFAWYSYSLPNPNKIIDRQVAESTKIYDRKGETVLYDVHGTEKRTLVQLSDIPDFVKWSTISAEDKTFYQHHGFNLQAMFKGMIIDPLLGRRARGGSTLTQQLVKNAILTNERSLTRKLKEFILAYKIEQSFSKDEILQMYLNEIPYGSVVYGVEAASQTFYNKPVKDLNLAEASLLASLPQAPTYYSPYGNHVDELFNRQTYVLDQMVKNGYITQAEMDEAKKVEIKFGVKREAITAPHFVMYVKELLTTELGREVVERGGLKVITTIDLDKQTAAEEAVRNGVDARGKKFGFTNAALLAMNPKNGQVLAMVGSTDYFDTEIDGNVNVTMRLRQPGSSIKPLIYAAAFQKGYTPNTILYDVDTIFKTDTKDYHPRNYDLKEHGPVTMRTALQGSLNIPAVKTMYLVGVPKVLDFLEMMGYSSFETRSRFGLALVLGGAEVTMLDHTAAYSTFANNGVYNAPAFILRVEDNKGNVIKEFEQKENKVLDSNLTAIMSNVLSDNNARTYVFGANNYLTLGDRPAAAKTGTTNDYHDAWTMGYTPSLTAGVWVGNNNNTEMSRGADGSVVAAPIWNEFMKKALANTPIEQFPAANIPVTGKANLDGAAAPETVVRVDKFTGKLATDLTPASFVEERKYQDAHCILYYVDKDNPTGPYPPDPNQDPSFASWEGAVQDWVKRAGSTASTGGTVSLAKPPTEYDDVHIEENRPTVFIKSPSANQTIRTVNLEVSVDASAPRGIARIEYYLDDRKLANKTSEQYYLNAPLSSYFGKGFHKLRVVAYDDVDNSNEASIDINIAVDLPSPQLTLVAPSNGASFSASQFPVKVTAELTDPSVAKKIDFYARNKDTGSSSIFSTIFVPDSRAVSVDWPEVFERGSYELTAEITDYNGGRIGSNGISVIVN